MGQVIDGILVLELQFELVLAPKCEYIMGLVTKLKYYQVHHMPYDNFQSVLNVKASVELYT